MQTPNFFNNFVSNLIRKKNPDEFLEQSAKGGLKKTLNAFDLISDPVTRTFSKLLHPQTIVGFVLVKAPGIVKLVKAVQFLNT